MNHKKPWKKNRIDKIINLNHKEDEKIVGSLRITLFLFLLTEYQQNAERKLWRFYFTWKQSCNICRIIFFHTWLDSSQCGLIDFVISEKMSKIKFRFYKKCSFFVVVFVVYFVGIIYFKKSSAVVFSKNSDYILIFTLNIYWF